MWSCSSASTGDKEHTSAKTTAATTFHLEYPIIFRKKVYRKTGDVSFARLSHLLPGCMTEAIFRDALVRIWRKSLMSVRRMHVRLAEKRHVADDVQSGQKTMDTR